MISKLRKSSAKASKGIYLIMAFSMVGVSTIPVFFKILFGRKPVAATVNGLSVGVDEYRYAVAREQRILSAYREQLGAQFQKILAMLGRSDRAEETALEQLVVEKVLLSVAQSIPIHLSDGFVKMELSKPRILYGVLGEIVPDSLISEQGILRVDVLKRFLQLQGLSMNMFEEMVENLLKEQLVMMLAQGSALVTDVELKAALATQFAPRDIRIEMVPFASFATEMSKKEVSAEELASFYESQNRSQSRYWSPEKRSGTVWTFDLSAFKVEDGSAEEKLSSQEREQRKEQRFLAEAEQVISAGKSKEFARFLEEYHGKQGSLKKVQKVEGDASIATLFGLSSPDEMGVGASKGRGYIVKLAEITTREQIPFERISEEVAQDLRSFWAEEKAKSLLKSGVSVKTPGYTEEIVRIEPGQKEDAAFKKGHIPLAKIQGLVVEGATLHGATDQGAYKLTLVKRGDLNEKLLKEQGGIARVKALIWEKQAGVIGRNFIASLRDHAILSWHTLDQRAS